MSTQQRQIRDAVFALISSAVGSTATVYRAPRRDVSAPAVSIYSKDDRPLDPDCDMQQSHERAYTLQVEIRVEDRPEEDATDALATLIRNAVLHDDSLGLLARRIVWTSQIWAGSEDDAPLAGTIVDFQIHYLWRPEWL